MSLYVATDEHGRGVRCITEFENRADLQTYAQNYVNGYIPNNATISNVLELLYDSGPGFGARNHFRISRKDAIATLKHEPWIKNNTFL